MTKLSRSGLRSLLLTTLAALPLHPHLAAQATTAKGTNVHSTWRDYGGAPDGSQYSSLTQINRSNVSTLQTAWSFPTGDAKGYLFNPLVIGRTMYVLARNNAIVALDATNGRVLWQHDFHAKTSLITTRGLNYWTSKDNTDQRLILAVDNELQELDARTGNSITTFGSAGRVDLREDLGRDPKTLLLVQSYNPGRVFENLLIIGSATNEEYTSGPGDVRAYDVLTGKLAWTFHTVPHPGETGYDTWPKDAWKSVGGANVWSAMSLDEKRGVIYIPTASPKYNFYGANRPGDNLFGDSLVALNARTGKLVWYYQMVHHDIWDYDNPSTPLLATVHHDGKLVDVVAQPSKVGFLWVFNRDTGKPLWPVEERPVPKSDMPGEETAPTQPFPSKPPAFARQAFTEKDLSPYLEPGEREELRKQMLAAHNQGLFTPPAKTDTVEMPGNNGGANFGGAAIDPVHGYLYIVSKDLPAMLKLTLQQTAASGGLPEVRGRSLYQANCSLCHGAERMGQPPGIPSLVDVTSRLSEGDISNIVRYGKPPMPGFPTLTEADVHSIHSFLTHPDLAPASAAAPLAEMKSSDPATAHYRSGFGFMFAKSGLPVITPPWTTLTAYDLNTGTIRWQEPLGEIPELAAEGHRDTGSHFPKVNPVVTAGGILFTGTRDRRVRAIDTTNGKVLWEKEVGAALEGMPAVYQVDGREYVAFCAAARATTFTHAVAGRLASTAPIDGAYIVFALPQKQN